MKKKFVCLCLFVALLCASCGIVFWNTQTEACQVYAQETLANENLDMLSQNYVGVLESKEIVSSEMQPIASSSGTLPTSYSMKEEILINTENQNPYGLCWDFASTKALETFMAKNFGEYYDFSEAWFALAFAKYDSLNHIYKDMFYDTSGDYQIGDGGDERLIKYALNNYGLVLENDFPFQNLTYINHENMETYFDYYKTFANTNTLSNITFGSYPNYNQYTQGSSAYLNIINGYKDYLYNYGSIIVSINIGGSYCYFDGSGNYISCCTNTSVQRNHAVSIIGWDDTFSYSGHTGAWIALNSWSVSTNLQFIYIMYDDVVASNNLMYISSVDINNTTYNLANFDSLKTDFELTSSNSNYTNNDISSSTLKQKNIFDQDSNLLYELTYTYPSSYDNSLIYVDISQCGENKNDLFNVSVDKVNKAINIKAKTKNTLLGTYKLEFKVDTNADGTIDTASLKQFTIFTHAEIGTFFFGNSKYVSGSYYWDEQIGAIYNIYSLSSPTNISGVWTYEYNVYIKDFNIELIQVILADYSNVSKIKINNIQYSLSNSINLWKSDYTYTIYFETNAGSKYSYTVNIINNTTSSSTIYNLINSGEDISTLTNISNMVVPTDNTAVQIDDFTFNRSTLNGWYYDAEYNYPLYKNNGHYYIRYNDIPSTLKSKNSLILYAKTTPISYDLTYKNGVNTISNVKPQKYNKNQIIILPTPPQIEHYTLKSSNWFSDSTLSSPCYVLNSSIVSANKILYGNYEKVKYNINIYTRTQNSYGSSVYTNNSSLVKTIQITYQDYFDISNSYEMDLSVNCPNYTTSGEYTYYFTGNWFDSTGTKQTSNKQIVGDINLYAEFDLEYYLKICYDVNCGDAGQDNIDTYASSTSSLFTTLDNTTFTKKYYHLKGWYINNNSSYFLEANTQYNLNDYSSLISNKILTLYAVYEENKYSVKFEVGTNASCSAPITTFSNLSYTDNVTTLNTNTVSKNYYECDYWELNSKEISANVSYIVSDLLTLGNISPNSDATITLNAHYKSIKYTMTFVDTYAGTEKSVGDFTSAEYTYESTNIAFPNKTLTGYTLYWQVASSAQNNWTQGAQYKGSLPIANMYGNVTFNAVWVVNSYLIKIKDGENIIDYPSKTFEENFTIPDFNALNALFSNSHYHIDSLKIKNNSYVFEQTYTIESILSNANLNPNTTTEITFEIVWEGDVYNISYSIKYFVNNTQNTARSYDSSALLKTHTYGTKSTLENISQSGYDFKGWFKDENYSQKINKNSILEQEYTNDFIVYGKFEAKTYNLNVYYCLDGSKTSTSLAVVPVEFDTVIDLSNLNCFNVQNVLASLLTNEKYYTFEGKYFNNSLNEISSLTIETNTNIYAGFVSHTREYTIYFKEKSESEDILQQISVEYNQTFEYSGVNPQKAPTNQYNYSFIGWSINEGVENALSTLKVGQTLFPDANDCVYLYPVFLKTLQQYLLTLYFDEDTPITTFDNLNVKKNYGTIFYYGNYSSSIKKPSTKTHNYSLIGFYDLDSGNQNIVWDNSSSSFELLKDTNLCAVFEETIRTYEIKYYYKAFDTNTNLIISELTENVTYGEDGSFGLPLNAPEKDHGNKDVAKTYEFAGWIPNVYGYDKPVEKGNVDISLEYYAYYEESAKLYNITFIVSCKGEATQQYNETLAYGSMYDFVPTKQSTYAKDYNFVGWFENSGLSGSSNNKPTITNKVLTYYGSFEEQTKVYEIELVGMESPISYLYNSKSINLLNEEYILSKPSTYNLQFAFDGWWTKNGEQTGDWGEEIKSISIKSQSEAENVVSVLYPKFVSSAREYTINLYSSVALEDTRHANFGQSLVNIENPSKKFTDFELNNDENKKYNYNFLGWSKNQNQDANSYECLDLVINQEFLNQTEIDTGVIALYPVFEKSIKTYKLSFYNNTQLLTVKEYCYGDSIKVSDIPAQKESTKEYNYIFKGWYLEDESKVKDGNIIIQDIDVYAGFNKEERIFEIDESSIVTIGIVAGCVVGGIAIISLVKIGVSKRERLANKNVSSKISEVRFREEELKIQKAEIEKRIAEIRAKQNLNNKK